MLLHYLIDCLFTSKQYKNFTVIINIWGTIREVGQDENFSSLLLLVLLSHLTASVLPNLPIPNPIHHDADLQSASWCLAQLLKNNGKAQAARQKSQYSHR